MGSHLSHLSLQIDLMDKNIYFFTDIHGHYPLFRAILNWCNNDIIIYGGDACDRGKGGYNIIKELLEAPNVIYLYGNHEELFTNAAKAILKTYYNNKNIHSCDVEKAKLVLKHMRTLGDEDVKLHLINGGESTLIDWLLDGAPKEIIDRLSILPRTYSYKNYDFCHAGSTYTTFSYVSTLTEYKGAYDEQAIIWDRNCIPLGWETGRIGIFGHTPTVFLPHGIYGHDTSLANIHPCYWQDKMGGRKKRGGWKLDMDTGAYATNRAFVFNCNNSTITGFEMNENNQIKTIDQYQINFS